LRRLRRALGPRATVVFVGGEDAGACLVPSIDHTYPLEDVQLAMRQLEAGRVRGKVAITLSE
jgi:hypothetical protein